MTHQALAALLGEVEEAVHGGAVEALAVLGGALDFDEATGGGQGDVHVDVGPGIVNVIEIQAFFAVNDADTDGGELVDDGGGGIVIRCVISGGDGGGFG